MYNNTAQYDTIGQLVKIGGKKSLLIEDKNGWNTLHWACELGDEATIRLLIRIGGKELVDTLESERLDEDDTEFFHEFLTSSNIESALLLHDYINAIYTSKKDVNIDQMFDTLLESKLSYREVNEIMSIQDIPYGHHQKLQDYSNEILKKELESFAKMKEMVPLMRSKITVVGRGQDGKTSTINSLKGLPFQPYCESTKGTATSEVNAHEVGIHVTSVSASGVSFQEAERDSYSTKRTVAKQLIDTSRDFNSGEMMKVEKKENIPTKESHKFMWLIEKLFNLKTQIHVPREAFEGKEIDTAEKKGDFELDSKDGKLIRFTIFDNGGQSVFRSIQHLFLSRQGIFIVVFDMMKIYDERFREEALEHLKYWLASIKIDACLEEDLNKKSDPSTMYPPIILVGTHYDEFLKLKEDPMRGLQLMNEVLVDNLPLSDLVPLPQQSDVPQDREQIYNSAQHLCFWPVDNSDPNDSNIKAIRTIILESAMKDPCVDISQEVPISFLQTMDKLTSMSKEVPILPIDSDDSKEYSVVKVMQKCGVFEDSMDGELHQLDICKIILKQYQNIGQFIYFDKEGLDKYCILDPQWLINMITYIVRDFKLHRFRRDFNAMALNHGESWKSLLNKGILDGALVRKLWLDREYEGFLTELMLELGIFGRLCGDDQDLSKAKFTIPIAVTSSSSLSREISLAKVRDYLSIVCLDNAVKENIGMSRCSFTLVPFYSHLVNRLVSQWSSAYIEEDPPELLPCAANLCLGRGYKFSILINEEHSTLDILVSDQNKIYTILKYISEACSFVNVEAYQSRLALVNPAVNIGIEVILRNVHDKCTRNVAETKQKNEEFHPNLQALIAFLKNEKLALKIHENGEDITPEELIQMYYRDKNAFVKDILPELGIITVFEKHRFIAILESKPKPLEDELYAIFNFLDDDRLAVEEEEKVVVNNMRMSSYFSFAYKVLRDETFADLHCALAAHPECKVVHFGMHADSIDTFHDL